jgi:phosphoglycerate dehydrogenase-like enzyme
MKKKKVLLTCPEMLNHDAMNYLIEKFELILNESCSIDQETLLDELKQSNGYILGGNEIVTDQIAENVRHLKKIFFVGKQANTSFEKTAWEILKDRVVVSGSSVYAVALSTYGRIMYWDVSRRQTIHTKSFINPPGPKRMLAGQTLLVVGAGAIGQMVIKITNNKFEKTIYSGGRKEKEELKGRCVYYPDLLEAFSLADVASLHLELIPGITEGIIKKEHIIKLRDNALFINNARAGLIKPEELYLSMQIRKDVSFVFDGFYIEGQQFNTLGIKEDNDLLKKIIRCENFFYSGHTATLTDEGVKENSDNLIKAIEESKWL